MNVRDAATTLINEFCIKAQNGKMSHDEREGAEAATIAALYEAAKRDSRTAISGIARNLYCVLNPLSTVPVSYYIDSNFELLATRVTELLSHTHHGTNKTRVDLGGPSHTGANAELIACPDTIVDPVMETSTLQSELEATQRVLIDYARTLSSFFTIKPEWHGREHEIIVEPTREAAEKLIELRSSFAADSVKSGGKSSVVPESWADAVANGLYDCLERSITVMWVKAERRDAAIKTSAHKISTTVQQNFEKDLQNSIHDANAWARKVAESIFAMMLHEDFKPYAPAITSSMQMMFTDFLFEAISADIIPAVDFSETKPIVQKAVATNAPKQRGPWKMNWSAARLIIDELNGKTFYEPSLLKAFSNWFDQAEEVDEIKGLLTSQIVITEGENTLADLQEERAVQAIHFVYQNYRGEIGVREAMPIRLSYGSNQWHRESQWLLEAFDFQQNAMRTFAVKDIIKFLDGEYGAVED